MTANADTVVVYQGPWDWEFLWNRAQPLAQALSQHAEVHYLDAGMAGPRPPWDAPCRLLARLPGVSRWHRQRVAAIGPSLSVWSWRGLYADPTQMILGDRPEHQYRRLGLHLRRRAAEGASVWLLSSRPWAPRLRRLHPWDRIAVDIEDPWFELNWGRNMGRTAVLDAIRDADVVFANGAAIAGEYEALSGRQVVSLPNGVDAAFLDLLAQQLPVPDFYRAAPPGSRAVFTGNVNDRLDFRMLADLVSEPGWTFFFVGRDSVPDGMRQAWQGITSRPNVRVVPPRPHREIAAVLQHADALLLPYSLSGHEKMFPAKLFEYAATGRPIVTTIDFTAGAFVIPSSVTCASVAACREALRRIRGADGMPSPDRLRTCVELARRNTWDARAADFMARVTAAGRRASGGGRCPAGEPVAGRATS